LDRYGYRSKWPLQAGVRAKLDTFDAMRRGPKSAVFLNIIRLVRPTVVECELATEAAMAKGSKEAKKPKGDKPKGVGSAYKQSQGAGSQPVNAPTKKK
jgi:hypothetical protein